MKTDEKVVAISESDLREIISDTVKETLVSLGATAEDPHSMQKDFIYLRSGREASEAMKKKTQLTLLGTFIIAILSALAVGLKDYFK